MSKSIIIDAADNHAASHDAEAGEERMNEAAAAQPIWRDFVQLAKPGILFSNSITAFGGFWVASKGDVSWVQLLYMLIGTALVMASGCVLNNYLDRDFDMKMARTQERALPSGRLPSGLVLGYGILLGVVGLSVLCFLLGSPLAALLGVVGLFVYVWVYTAWLKRTSTFSTSIGAIAGAVPPVIGYCAVTQTLDAGALILFLIMFLWQPPHFWALAIRRKEEYAAAGFPLLPVVKGNFETKLHMIRYTVMLVPVSLMLYLYNYVGLIYLAVATVLGMTWVVMSFMGFKTKDDVTWAKKNFVFSINYLTILFIVMVIDTVTT
ncbi:heme o synthase [Paenibacillus sp. y28]|uniref:heme o synthase n=1 Tax=Paenibacillus sp. y28 TaxID=3129110 RepID=UPI003017080A